MVKRKGGGVEEQRKTYLDREATMALGRNSDTEIPKNPQRWPKLRLRAIVERVLKLVFPCNQIGGYPNYHDRAFIQ